MLGNEQAKIKLVATETVVEKKGRPPRPLTFLAVYCRTADPEDTADSLKTPAQAIRIDASCRTAVFTEIPLLI